MIEVVGNKTADHKIYLLDRGLIDRYIFTRALLQDNRVDKKQTKAICDFLTLPHLLEKLDGVFIFETAPEIALRRKYENKIRPVPGEVMNERFLSVLRLAAKEGGEEAKRLSVRNVNLISTQHDDGQSQETAQFVINTIRAIIQE